METSIASSEYVNDPRYSRTFELPAVNGRPAPLKITYADFGYRNTAHPDQENVLLFFGPLLCSRLFHIAKDAVANKNRVRLISLDRPGFGGTPAVDGDGMSLWREATMALLSHLDIRHVAVACHSGGTVYAVDFLLHYPGALHPERPYLAIGAPWILPKHTSSTTLALTQSLPASMIATSDKLARLVNNHIGPFLGSSFRLSSKLVSGILPRSQNVESLRDSDALFEEKLWPWLIKRVYAEGVKGMSTDAVLFMQKGVSGWSDWGDYDVGVPRLAEALRTTGKRLTVEVYYAETDILIGNGGTKGPLWFDQCWRSCSDVISHQSTTINGADHDGIWDMKWGVMQRVFERIGHSAEPGPSGV